MANTSTKNTLHFRTEAAARKHLERVRWPYGAVCAHCGSQNATAMKGEKHRAGLYNCKDCRKQFSVTVGTLFEGSKIPLHKWLTAVHLLASSKKGFSSHQLHRTLKITYKSAWFMTHRIREAMRDPIFAGQLGGDHRIVEADETFWGNKRASKGKRGGWRHKEKVFSLLERGGNVRSFHEASVGAKTLKPIIRQQVAQDTYIMTDGSGAYHNLESEFAGHHSVDHEKAEYVRGPIHVNGLENYYSILKRGLSGVYQHVGAKHLKRYIGEFDFRYNNRHLTDDQRAMVALLGIAGKRLRYREPLKAEM